MTRTPWMAGLDKDTASAGHCFCGRTTCGCDESIANDIAPSAAQTQRPAVHTSWLEVLCGGELACS
jgi:hypothetical protein